jgi:mannose-6-phosphate isomerase-like protein (cupin superfamily)
MTVNTGTGQLWVLGHLVRPIETAGDYGLLAIVSRPEVPGPPPHHHPDAAELFYIVDGRLDVMLDGRWQTLGPGESLTVPTGGVHTFINRGERDASWITAFSPRGFERFFTAFGVPAEADDAFAQSVSESMIQRVGATCAQYGMIIDV